MPIIDCIFGYTNKFFKSTVYIATMALMVGIGLIREAVEKQRTFLGFMGMLTVALSSVALTQIYHIAHGGIVK